MRKATFVLATLMAVGACLTLFGNDMAAASGTAVADTCQEKLNNPRYYDCHVVNSDSFDDDFCVTFSFNGGETFNMNDLLWRTWVCECEAERKLPDNLWDTEFGTSRTDFVCGVNTGDDTYPAGLHGYLLHGLNLQGVFPFYSGDPSFVARCEKRTTPCGD